MEFHETFVPGAEPEESFTAFNFEEIDARIHPDAAPHSEHEYRAAGRAFVAFLDSVLAWQMTYQTEHPQLPVAVVAFACGRSHILGGVTQKELADRLGLTKAAISKAVKNFQASFGNDIAGIEPMPGQRSQSSCVKFSAVRRSQLTTHENEN